MRTLNQQEIAAVNGGLSALDILNAINGKPNLSLFASTDTKVITSIIALAVPYIKPLLQSLFQKLLTKTA